MSVKKLLCGAALASLMIAPAASALDLVLATSTKLAEEVDFAATGGVAGNLPQIVIQTDAELPQNNGYKLTINLSGPATYEGFSATAVESANHGVSAGDLSGQIVSTNGADGDATVTVLFDVTAAGVGLATNQITLDLPVAVTGCGSDVGVDILLTDPNDNPIEGGSASLVTAVGGTTSTPALECVDAFQATIAADATAAQLSLASDFEKFKDGVNNVDDTFVSTLTFDALPADPAVATSPVMSDLLATAVGGDVASAEFEVVFESLTGIDTLSVLDANGAALVGAAATVTKVEADSKFTVAITNPEQEADQPIVLQVELEGDVQVAPQVISITEAELTFTDAANKNFADEEITVTGDGANPIELEGDSFGPFDWVGDASKGTANIFRVTGVSATPPEAAVTLVNSSEGVDGTWTITLDPANVSNGEYLVRASDIEAAVGAPYGRADVTFTFFTSDSLDVDRLMSTGGIVTAYGNDNQNTDQGDD